MSSTRLSSVLVAAVALIGLLATSAFTHDLGYRGGRIPLVGLGHHRPYRGYVRGHIGNRSVSTYSRSYSYRESYHAYDGYGSGYAAGCYRPYYGGRVYRPRFGRVTHYRGFSRGYDGYGYGYGYGAYGYGGGYPSTYARHHSRGFGPSNAYVFYSERTDSTPSWRSQMTAKQERYEAWKRVNAKRAALEKAVGTESTSPPSPERSASETKPAVASGATSPAVNATRSRSLSDTTVPKREYIKYADETAKRVDAPSSEGTDR